MPTIGQHDYPLTTAADGIEKAKKIALQFKGQPFDRTSLAAALGNKSAETGAFNQLLADLRRFGVIEGRGDGLQATPLAQRLAVPTNPQEYSEAVYEMLSKVPLFKLLYEHFEGKPPSEDELLATLINITKADRAAVQAVVSRIRNNYLSGLSQVGSIRPTVVAPFTGGRTANKSPMPEPRTPGEPENVIEVRAGEVSLRYPLTVMGLKLMKHNFEGDGFWKILEDEISKSKTTPVTGGDNSKPANP